MQFGPDLKETCSAKEADDFTLVEPRLAVWRAFCGAESKEAAPDGTRLRGASLNPAYSPNPARLASIGGFAARDVLSLGL